MLALDPGILRKLKRFRKIRRGYFSFIGLTILVLLSLFAELLVSNRALFVSYEGKFYFPTYGEIIPGRIFGKTGYEADGEVNYRSLAEELGQYSNIGDSAKLGFVILPLIPYSPLEIDVSVGEEQGARPPSISRRHLLGTDTHGRDILARIVYGFRMAIFFSIAILIAEWGLASA